MTRFGNLLELDAQLSQTEARSLRDVLYVLAANVHRALDSSLIGVYVKGSFALGAGDVHADVDFLVITTSGLTPQQELLVRETHRELPNRSEHWAHNLEGSYVTLSQHQQPPDPETLWLYVDNGQSEMEMSSHDNTEVFRWVLKHRALTVVGPSPSSLIEDVPAQRLRDEAAGLAITRREEVAADPDYLHNGWGQPHEVLTHCRMLYTASVGEVAGKIQSAEWCLRALPAEWHPLITAAINDRPNPWIRVRQRADPERASRTWDFVQFMTSQVTKATTTPVTSAPPISSRSESGHHNS